MRHKQTLTGWARALAFGPALALTAWSSADVKAGYVENLGQWDSDALYMAQTPGANVWITPGGPVYDFYRNVPISQTEARREGQVVRVEFVGSQPGVGSAADRLPGQFNWLVGDSSDWIVGAGHYGRAMVEGIYPGVGGVWYFDEDRPRYDLVVNPGFDPESIRMRYHGANGVWVDELGQLVLDTRFGPVVETDLFVYQVVDGARRAIPAEFRVFADGTVGFDLGLYDASKPLVIDPIVFATFVGGTAGDATWTLGTDVDFDSTGNSYLATDTDSVDFPTTAGAYETTSQGQGDFAITKLSADGSALIYSTYVGGSQEERRPKIDVVGTTPYVVGTTRSSNFPTTAGAFDTTFAQEDAVVFKLAADGASLDYSTFLGGAATETGADIVVNGAGFATVVGTTNSQDYPTVGNPFDDTYSGGVDVFVTTLNSAGSGLAASTYFGGSETEFPRAVDLRANGQVIVAGFADYSADTIAEDFPTTTGALQEDYQGGTSDGFVVRFTSNLAATVFSTFVGGSGDDVINDAEVGPGDSVVVVGSTNSADLPIGGTSFDPTPNGIVDAMVAWILSDGTSLVSSTYLGGPAIDEAVSVQVGADGNVYVIGSGGFGFPSTEGSPLVEGGFLSKFSRTGQALVFSTGLGPGTSGAEGFALRGGVAHIAGSTDDAFQPTIGAYDTSHNGGSDAFAMGFDVMSEAVAGVVWSNGANQPLLTVLDGLTWESNTALTHFQGWEVWPADFDGDGDADLLARDPANGNLMVSIQEGGAEVTRQLISTIPDWNIQFGDFNGDGSSDILLQHPTSGQVLLWLMQGTSRMFVQDLGLRVGWQGITPDLNGDGKDDLVWKLPSGDVVGWLMDGAVRTQLAVLTFQPTYDLHYGDTDGDGDDDLIFEDLNTGIRFIIRMNGLARQGAPRAIGAFPGREIIAVRDFDGDGREDLALREIANDRIHVWRIENNTVNGTGSPGLAAGWNVTVGDYNGDGKADFFLHSPTLNFAKIWLMDGPVLGSSVGVGQTLPGYGPPTAVRL